MKINKYIIGLGLTFSFLFASCDSFLDPAKDGKLGEEDIWNETRIQLYRQCDAGSRMRRSGTLGCDK